CGIAFFVSFVVFKPAPDREPEPDHDGQRCGDRGDHDQPALARRDAVPEVARAFLDGGHQLPPPMHCAVIVSLNRLLPLGSVSVGPRVTLFLKHSIFLSSVTRRSISSALLVVPLMSILASSIRSLSRSIVILSLGGMCELISSSRSYAVSLGIGDTAPAPLLAGEPRIASTVCGSGKSAVSAANLAVRVFSALR